MTMQDSYVRARINRNLKTESEKVLRQLGLSTTEAIRLFLTQVSMRRGLPFDVVLPGSEDNDDLLRPQQTRQAALDSLYDD
jgi:DNA-damage-inducible protein J